MKLIKRTVIGLSIFVFLIAAAVFVVITFYKKELTTMLIDNLKVNYGLNLKVEEIKVSFLSNWPHASVQLKNVFISSDKAPAGSLVRAGSIALSFNLKRMMNKEFIVQYVAIKDADINFVKNAEGIKNFEVKPQPVDTAVHVSPITFAVHKITIKNSRFKYINEARGQKIEIGFLNNTIRLKHYLDGLQGSLEGKVFVTGLLFHPRRGEFLTNTAAYLDLDVTYFKETKVICIRPPSHIEIKGHNYNVMSLIRLGEDKHLALVFESKDVNLQDATALLTPKIRKVLSAFELTNTLDVKTLIAVHIGKKEDPVLLIDVTGKDNSLLIGNSKIPYSHLNFTGKVISLDPSLQRGNIEKARVIFQPVKGNVYDFPFTASVTITNLANPNIMILANLRIEASKIKFRIGNEFKLGGSGIAKIRYYGPTEKLNEREFLGPAMRLNANMIFNDFSYKELNRPYVYTVNGKANLNNKDLKFEKLLLKTNFGNAVIKGKAEDFVNFVLGNTTGFKTTLSATSESLNLDPLFIKRDTTPVLKAEKIARKEKRKAEKEEEQPGDKIDYSQFEFNVTLFSKKLAMRKIEAQNAKINLHYRDNFVNIKSLAMSVCDGKIEGKASLRNFNKLDADVVVEGVDVNTLFTQFENFGQEAIVSDNLKGKLDVDAVFKSNLDESMKIRPETMSGDVKLKLKDGHIMNFEPIQNLSNFLFKNRDFNDVAFSEIEESFILRGYEMEIKELEISSNILDLYVVNGYYNFKGNSNINILVPWSNLKRRGKNYIPRNSGKAVEDAKGVKLNFAGPAKKLRITLGHKEVFKERSSM